MLTIGSPTLRIVIADEAAIGSKGELVSKSDNIVVCGPRCVQFVLRHYGRDEDLIDLVQELQWPDLGGGATLSGLRQALENRGIHTFAMRVEPGARLNWHSPAVLHWRGEERTLGHFVVWLPSSGTRAVLIWDGVFGTSRMTRSELASQMSGVILLTSASPIEHPEAAVMPPWQARSKTIVWLAVSLGAMVVFVCYRWFWWPEARARGPKQESLE